MTGGDVMRNPSGNRVEVIGWDRPGKVVDERIVARWVSLIADRINKPLSPETVLEYIRLFDYARLSNRALDQALSKAFASVRGFWPSPNEIIESAKSIERELRPKLPMMNRADQDRRTADGEYASRLDLAAAWGKDPVNEVKLKEIKRRANFDICRAYHVKHVNELSPTAKEVRQATIVEGILAAIRLQDLVSSKDPRDRWIKATVLDTMRKAEQMIEKEQGEPINVTLVPDTADDEPAVMGAGASPAPTPEPGRRPFWVTFAKNPPGCIQARDFADAMKLATDLTGHVPMSAEPLPYPANPRINQVPFNDGLVTPSFCYKPLQCKGRGSCPTSPSCVE